MATWLPGAVERWQIARWKVARAEVAASKKLDETYTELIGACRAAETDAQRGIISGVGARWQPN